MHQSSSSKYEIKTYFSDLYDWGGAPDPAGRAHDATHATLSLVWIGCAWLHAVI